MNAPLTLAAPLHVSRWFNVASPLTLESLRGRVVVLHAFQMLCPGCVAHGLPQAQRIAQSFRTRAVSVIGLHSVFEHHAVMTEAALAAFIHEYRLEFPIAVDQPAADSPIPLTMQAYGLRGTPSLIIIDRAGRLRSTLFGHADDLQVGALIGALLEAPHTLGVTASAGVAGGCPSGVCAHDAVSGQAG
ncbi:peroxiredoxin family protein [Niveibacterium microcysteis]|uniref:Redoxin family protein n=1 Tax=Niveibacterium microcysteis TaxID=2811415 RepID=A0ABX7M4U0_9RHOO|nr:redoxin domain-containing protein [Niveibacterium microcysteis]QSI76761.1 redoxin family protein [Niveibacterium microcysteis]